MTVAVRRDITTRGLTAAQRGAGERACCAELRRFGRKGEAGELLWLQFERTLHQCKEAILLLGSDDAVAEATEFGEVLRP